MSTASGSSKYPFAYTSAGTRHVGNVSVIRPKNLGVSPTMLTAIRSRALEIDFVSSIAPVAFALDNGVLLDQANRRCDIDERVTC